VIRSRPDGVFNRTDLKRNYSPWALFFFNKKNKGARHQRKNKAPVADRSELQKSSRGFFSFGVFCQAFRFQVGRSWTTQRLHSGSCKGSKVSRPEPKLSLACFLPNSLFAHMKVLNSFTCAQRRKKERNERRERTRISSRRPFSSSSFSRARASVYPHKSIHRSEPPFGCKDGKIGSDDFLESDKRWWLKAPPGFPRRQERRLSSRGSDAPATASALSVDKSRCHEET